MGLSIVPEPYANTNVGALNSDNLLSLIVICESSNRQIKDQTRIPIDPNINQNSEQST